MPFTNNSLHLRFSLTFIPVKQCPVIYSTAQWMIAKWYDMLKKSRFVWDFKEATKILRCKQLTATAQILHNEL